MEKSTKLLQPLGKGHELKMLFFEQFRRKFRGSLFINSRNLPRASLRSYTVPVNAVYYFFNDKVLPSAAVNGNAQSGLSASWLY
jgi:hypothetical protein